jgi:hypothetical protein
MTVGVTKGLLRITAKSSSNFLNKLGNKQVVLQRMYLGARGNAKNLLKNFRLKNEVGATSMLLYIEYILSD